MLIGADPALAERVQALPEVDTVATHALRSRGVNGQSLQVLGIDPATYPKIATFQFAEGRAG